MSDSGNKRKFERHPCKIKAKFDYYEGDPDTIDINLDVPEKAKGSIIDISKGGVFIVTNERTTVGVPVVVHFKLNKEELNIPGRIVRTGSLENNPSETAIKFLSFLSSGNYYIAVEFNDPLEKLNTENF